MFTGWKFWYSKLRCALLVNTDFNMQNTKQWSDIQSASFIPWSCISTLADTKIKSDLINQCHRMTSNVGKLLIWDILKTSIALWKAIELACVFNKFILIWFPQIILSQAGIILESVSSNNSRKSVEFCLESLIVSTIVQEQQLNKYSEKIIQIALQ